LRDKNPAIRFEAACCLGVVREVSSVPQLIKVLEKEKDISVRQAAIMTCLSFGEDAKAAVPILAKMVVEEYDKQYGYGNGGSIGTDAARALSNIGEPAVSALACIVMDVKLKKDIRRTALSALGSMTGHAKPVAARAICQTLSDRDEKLRCDTAFTLGKLRVSNKQISAALLVAIAEDSPRVRLESVTALGKMHEADEQVRAALLVATADQSPYVRIEAATSIYHFDPQNPVVLATIIPGLDEREASVRGSACFALERIGAPKANPAIPKLANLVSDTDTSVRLKAIYALSTMAAQKANIALAIPALNLAASDPNWSIRHASQECLKRVKR
jgi:HEAT repeat protein